MKTLLAFVTLAVLICFAYSEYCRTSTDCTKNSAITKCAPGHALTCHNHACYCEASTTPTQCRNQDDCPSREKCHSGRGQYHCVDSECRCFYF